MSMELGPLVIELNNVNINSDTKDEGEWVLNENLTFKYVLFSFNNTSDYENFLLRDLIRHWPYMCQYTQIKQIVKL